MQARTLAVALVALTLGAPSAASAAPSPPAGSAFVRVNQVGYPATGAKRAYVMSTASTAGAAFTVRNASGATVLSGQVGPSLGRWSTTYGFVHPVDFDALSASGTYTINVAGPSPAASPPFRVDTGPNVYGGSLANALAFYQTERDGPNYVPGPLRGAPAHLNDANAMTYATPKVNSAGSFSGDLQPLGVRIDASGGWWDAGDYIKGVETLGYTTAMLLHGVRELPAQMGAGSAADFTAEAKFGTDFLLRLWDDPTRTFHYQVGIGGGNAKTTSDHDLWRLPQADDTFGGSDPRYRYIRNRPVFRAGPPGSPVSPNLAGRDAAAFALCFQVFKASDPTFANRCLLAAEHIYDLADTNPGQLTTYVPFSFYPETEWRSDLELGASELALALQSGGLPAGLPHTDPQLYLREAAHWANAYIGSPDDAADPLNLYDVSALAHYELHRALTRAGDPPGLETTRAALVADLGKAIDNAVAQASADPFQFGFPWATWDTTSHGAGLVVMASEYDQLTGTAAYRPWSSRWAANILGANAWGVSLIVGDGTTFPHCLHHQVANIAGALDGSAPILRGAAVEGTNGTLYRGLQSGMRACPPGGGDPFAQFNGQTAKFKDDVESFSTVEPAVDLTATSPLAFARLAAGLH